MKTAPSTKSCSEVPKLLKNVHDYSKRAMDIETSLRGKAYHYLPVEDFEDILHPVFKGRQWIWSLGTALGLVGFLQWYVGF